MSMEITKMPEFFFLLISNLATTISKVGLFDFHFIHAVSSNFHILKYRQFSGISFRI